MRGWWTAGAAVTGLALLVGTLPARATVEMQNAAKALDLPVKNCLYCHASPHAVEKMKEKARELDMSDGNCLLCHGAEVPASLNERGQWLVDQKDERDADEIDVSWLKDYEEPPPGDPPPPEAPEE